MGKNICSSYLPWCDRDVRHSANLLVLRGCSMMLSLFHLCGSIVLSATTVMFVLTICIGRL